MTSDVSLRASLSGGLPTAAAGGGGAAAGGAGVVRQAPAPVAAPAPAPSPSPSPQQRAAALAEAIDAANRALAGKGRELTFEFDKAIGRTVYRIVDTQTRQVVRQIPTEEALAIAQSLAQGRAVGALMTTRV